MTRKPKHTSLQRDVEYVRDSAAYDRGWHTRFLRRLVRAAVQAEILNSCSGNRLTSDDIAKELVP